MAEKNTEKKKIIALSDYEHVLHRPTMYIGSVEVSHEAVPIVVDGKLIQSSKNISVGFYKMMNEILDNAFDEAKRMKGEMKQITVSFDSFTSRVTVSDTGNGFYKGTEINKKTGINNIETAMTGLRAGTNFFNKDTTDTLIGTNGVGGSLVNMLSSEFSIETINDEMYFKKTWVNFEGGEKIERKVTKKDKKGTTISFIPRDKAMVHNEEVKLFSGCVWDKDYIHAQMIFRNFLKNNDDVISKLKFEVYFDGEKLDLDIPFLPEDNITIKTKIGLFIFWRKYENATSISFINGAQCVGIHQKIFQDWINDMFGDNYAHHFYETLILLNLPPKVVRFADQNKTKYAGGRWEIEHLIKKAFWNKLNYDIPRSSIFKAIKKAIEERMYNDAMASIKRKKKQKKQKISEKYIPPSTRKDTLFIVEGNCLDEDTPIVVYRDNERLILPIKEVLVGDEVITHNHRFKKIANKQRKLKALKEIILDNGEILKATEEHRFYVYDTKGKVFTFLPVKEIDTQVHKFVKSKLGEFIGCVEVLSLYEGKDEYKYGLSLDNGEFYENTEFHKYCVFDPIEQVFDMKLAKDMKEGDLIATFKNE